MKIKNFTANKGDNRQTGNSDITAYIKKKSYSIYRVTQKNGNF